FQPIVSVVGCGSYESTEQVPGDVEVPELAAEISDPEGIVACVVTDAAASAEARSDDRDDRAVEQPFRDGVVAVKPGRRVEKRAIRRHAHGGATGREAAQHVARAVNVEHIAFEGADPEGAATPVGHVLDPLAIDRGDERRDHILSGIVLLDHVVAEGRSHGVHVAGPVERATGRARLAEEAQRRLGDAVESLDRARSVVTNPERRRFDGGDRPKGHRHQAEHNATEHGRASCAHLSTRAASCALVPPSLKRPPNPGVGGGPALRSIKIVNSIDRNRGAVYRLNARSARASRARRWSPTSRRIPASAIARSASSRARPKGTCSAVPCTSTNSPAPVMTMFMSTSALESST